ncbi:MAG: homoserine O-succinyltransferase [Oscillospiraceae bacterium]
MPINISNNLPAYATLIGENVFVMTDDVAQHQDIRPLKIAILNLMPLKIETETQLLRLLSNTPLQVDIDLVQVSSHVSKNTSAEHLLHFYNTFDDIKSRFYDGLIITGAPVEQIHFTEVDYWGELCEIFEWSKTNVYSTFHICWGAQAGLFYHYGIPKYDLNEKVFGIFPHRIEKPLEPLLKGFDEIFMVPHSRHTEVRRKDIEKNPNLEVLTYSDISGVHIVTDYSRRQYFVTGHSEYDLKTLANEYFRDKEKGLKIGIPQNYFPYNDETATPIFSWRCHANLMFSNWLNYCVYQCTPYDFKNLKPLITK